MPSGSPVMLLYGASQMKPQPKEILDLVLAVSATQLYFVSVQFPLLSYMQMHTFLLTSLCMGNGRCIQKWRRSRNHTKYSSQSNQNNGWTGGEANFRGHRVIILGGNIAGFFFFFQSVICSSSNFTFCFHGFLDFMLFLPFAHAETNKILKMTRSSYQSTHGIVSKSFLRVNKLYV